MKPRRLLLMLAALAACGGVGPTTRADLAPTTVAPVTTTTGATTTTTAPLSDLGLARAVVTNPTDLPDGWAECCDPQVATPDELRVHICGSDDAASPPHRAGYARHYALDLQPDNRERGHLTSLVVIAASAADAAEEFSAVDSPGYQACVIQHVDEDVASVESAGAGVPETVCGRVAIDLGVDGATLDRYVSTVVVGDTSDTVHLAIARVVVGRVIARIEVRTYDTPADATFLAQVVDALAQRADALA